MWKKYDKAVHLVGSGPLLDMEAGGGFGSPVVAINWAIKAVSQTEDTYWMALEQTSRYGGLKEYMREPTTNKIIRPQTHAEWEGAANVVEIDTEKLIDVDKFWEDSENFPRMYYHEPSGKQVGESVFPAIKLATILSGYTQVDMYGVDYFIAPGKVYSPRLGIPNRGWDEAREVQKRTRKYEIIRGLLNSLMDDARAKYGMFFMDGQTGEPKVFA